MTPANMVSTFTVPLSCVLSFAQNYNPYVLPATFCSLPVYLLSEKYININGQINDAESQFNDCMYNHHLNSTLRFSPLRLPCDKELQELQSAKTTKKHLDTARGVAATFSSSSFTSVINRAPKLLEGIEWINNRNRS